MKRFYRYTRLKNFLNISTIFINYQQRVIAVYINYGWRPSPRCVFMFHGCITSSDMKYLLRHVPVTLISPINRCNFLLLPWKIAGKYHQSAGCYFEPWLHLSSFWLLCCGTIALFRTVPWLAWSPGLGQNTSSRGLFSKRKLCSTIKLFFFFKYVLD